MLYLLRKINLILSLILHYLNLYHCYICSNSEICLNLLLLLCNFKYMPDLTVNTTNYVNCFLSLLYLYHTDQTPKPTFIFIPKHYNTSRGYLWVCHRFINLYYIVRIKHRAFYIETDVENTCGYLLKFYNFKQYSWESISQIPTFGQAPYSHYQLYYIVYL